MVFEDDGVDAEEAREDAGLPGTAAMLGSGRGLDKEDESSDGGRSKRRAKPGRKGGRVAAAKAGGRGAAAASTKKGGVKKKTKAWNE